MTIKPRWMLGIGALEKKICEVCGHKIDFGEIEKHHIVPMRLTKEAGIPESRILTLCHDCHQELHMWYSAKVASMSYNTKTKRFETKSRLEMCREYESTFDSFVKYKRGQTKTY